MRVTESFRSPELVEKLKQRIAAISRTPIRIMEFCGTHTHAVCRYGIREMVPRTVEMLSGPGCPVCVTDVRSLDYAMALSMVPGAIIATFGDLLKIPGSRGTLQHARARGARVEMVYSPLDALKLARRNPGNSIIFLGIGFETTAPTVAASIVQAEKEGIRNFYVYSMHKITPPAMKAILDAGEVGLGGILCPGHVSTVTGWKAWQFLSDVYHIPSAVAGFEPVDVLLAVAELVEQHERGTARVVNAYPRSVTAEGNRAARETMARVFDVGPAPWRGLGTIPESGLSINEEYAAFDAEKRFPVDPGETIEPRGCHCGEVIRGVMTPGACPLFRKSCTPMNPIGPCMVSSEGTCAAYYLYG